MANKQLAQELEAILESSLDSIAIPYKKGNSIRIKNMIVRESKNGFLVYNTETNRQVARTFCKTSALAIAKNYAHGRNIINDAMIYDRIIEKNYHDAIFYKNVIKKTKKISVKETREIRLEIAIDKTRYAKDHLDRFIFGS